MIMEYKNIQTICPYCGCGCALNLEVIDGQIIGVLPVNDHPVGQGSLCIKGWNAHSFVQHEDRLTTPLIRENGDFREASWAEAISVVADRLAAIKAESGPDSIGVLASAKCTNEENYLLQKFTRAVIGTNNIDHCARL
jgi:predicted molibdopterin-dependent oxidoreductase YjgC